MTVVLLVLIDLHSIEGEFKIITKNFTKILIIYLQENRWRTPLLWLNRVIRCLPTTQAQIAKVVNVSAVLSTRALGVKESESVEVPIAAWVRKFVLHISEIYDQSSKKINQNFIYLIR